MLLRYSLRTLLVIGLAGLPIFHASAFGAKAAGLPAVVVLLLAAAAWSCIALQVACFVGILINCSRS